LGSLFRPLRSKMPTAPRGNDWSTKRRMRKASFVNPWTGRSCSLECCDYTQQHTERWRTVPCRSLAKEKRRLRPTAKGRKRNSESDDVSSVSKREKTEKFILLPVYQKPRPVVTKKFFAPPRVRKCVTKHHLQTTILKRADHPP
jgi:hypothetical protein